MILSFIAIILSIIESQVLLLLLALTLASTLIEGVTREVIESFLLLKKGTYKLGNKLKTTPILCRLEVQPIVEYCQKNLKLWQTLAPHICSPYQRPYFSSQNRIKSDLSLEIRQRLSAMLKGFSFYHLAVILNQDKLQLAQSLHPYIKDGAVLLHDPNPPFNQLPKTFVQLSKSPGSLENLSPTLRNNGSEGVTRNPDILDKPSSTQLSMAPTVEGFKGLSKMSEFVVGGAVDKLQTPMESATPTRTVMFGVPYSSPTKGIHKIVCVDDSPTVLREINYFLNDDSFSVVPISDPVKALMQIIRVKPDLILLDIGMPELDGYEFCRLLRKHSRFKSTPIIMVTGSTGILDRVKAKFVGSSGYLTKPFDKTKLLKTMFKHLA